MMSLPAEFTEPAPCDAPLTRSERARLRVLAPTLNLLVNVVDAHLQNLTAEHPDDGLPLTVDALRGVVRELREMGADA